VKYRGDHSDANSNGNSGNTDNGPHYHVVFFLWFARNHLFKRLPYFSHGDKELNL